MLGPLLNDYLTGMTDLVFEHDGTVAKIVDRDGREIVDEIEWIPRRGHYRSTGGSPPHARLLPAEHGRFNQDLRGAVG